MPTLVRTAPPLPQLLVERLGGWPGRSGAVAGDLVRSAGLTASWEDGVGTPGGGDDGAGAVIRR